MSEGYKLARNANLHPLTLKTEKITLTRDRGRVSFPNWGVVTSPREWYNYNITATVS